MNEGEYFDKRAPSHAQIKDVQWRERKMRRFFKVYGCAIEIRLLCRDA